MTPRPTALVLTPKILRSPPPLLGLISAGEAAQRLTGGFEQLSILITSSVILCPDASPGLSAATDSAAGCPSPSFSAARHRTRCTKPRHASTPLRDGGVCDAVARGRLYSCARRAPPRCPLLLPPLAACQPTLGSRCAALAPSPATAAILPHRQHRAYRLPARPPTSSLTPTPTRSRARTSVSLTALVRSACRPRSPSPMPAPAPLRCPRSTTQARWLLARAAQSMRLSDSGGWHGASAEGNVRGSWCVFVPSKHWPPAPTPSSSTLSPAFKTGT
ncbi:hypothetical protein B0H19DRAFT_1083271 [Mycena capillaripes]|nr:hypothetical protein B0H19DRAFT_1083271 [Mycena capillaripes]